MIVVAVGEKGVTYGNGHSMPHCFLELVSSSKANAWDLTSGGCLAYFLITRRSRKLVERFLADAEALRSDLPLLGIGVVSKETVGQLNWLGRLKRDFGIDAGTMQHAAANVQGVQNYQDVLKELWDQSL